MGRAIDMENMIEKMDQRLKLVENALEELVQAKVNHVDLHNDTRTEQGWRKENVVAEGTKLKAKERRKIKKTEEKTVRRVESLL